MHGAPIELNLFIIFFINIAIYIYADNFVRNTAVQGDFNRFSLINDKRESDKTNYLSYLCNMHDV